jgi:hypothetical protein
MRLARDKRYSLLGPFISYKEILSVVDMLLNVKLG